MNGVIVNFKGGRHTQANNQMIVKVENISKRADASKLTGKKVTFETPSGKKLEGEIRSAHGNSGAVRVLFSTGMPGQAVGKNVVVE